MSAESPKDNTNTEEPTISVTGGFIRDLAIACLDDQHGISDKSFEFVGGLCYQSGNEDLLDKVECVNGRMFLPEGWESE